MHGTAFTNENDSNEKGLMEFHYTFPQEVIYMIVDRIQDMKVRKQDLVIPEQDEETLNNLCKVSASWEHAALKKLYSKINDEDGHLDKIVNKTYLAKYVTELEFLDDYCGHPCHQLKNVEFPNLKEVALNHDSLCDFYVRIHPLSN